MFVGYVMLCYVTPCYVEAFLGRKARDQKGEVVRGEAPEHEPEEDGDEYQRHVDETVDPPRVRQYAERAALQHLRVGAAKH